MKHIATVALMLNLGVAGVYAQQKPVKMTFSGTGGPSTINLQQPDTNTSEDNFAGNGTLGSFTFRNVRAISSCSGAVQHLLGPNSDLFFECGRRGRVSLPGRKSIEGQSHGGRRLHRFRGSAGPLYYDF